MALRGGCNRLGDIPLIRLACVRRRHHRRAVHQPARVGARRQARQRLVCVALPHPRQDLLIERVLRVLHPDHGQQRLARRADQFRACGHAPFRMRTQVCRIEPQQALAQIQPLAYAQLGGRSPITREQRRHETGLGALGLRQHQIALQRIVTVQRRPVGARIEPLGGHLAQAGQCRFKLLAHGRHQCCAARLGIRRPERCQHLAVVVQAKAGK